MRGRITAWSVEGLIRFIREESSSGVSLFLMTVPSLLALVATSCFVLVSGCEPRGAGAVLSAMEVREECDSAQCIKIIRHVAPVILPKSAYVEENRRIQGWYKEVADSLKREWEIEGSKCTERLQQSDGSWENYWVGMYVEPQPFEFDGDAVTLRVAVFPWYGGSIHQAEQIRIPVR